MSSSTPPRGNFFHPKNTMQLNVSRICKRFHEAINNPFICWKMIQAENSILNVLSNEVHVNLNMLGMLMLNMIARNIVHFGYHTKL